MATVVVGPMTINTLNSFVNGTPKRSEQKTITGFLNVSGVESIPHGVNNVDTHMTSIVVFVQASNNKWYSNNAVLPW